jgi:DNA polymerase-3 subunit delta
VLDAARTRSLFAEKKAVLVRQADGLRGDDSPLLAYLKDPTPGVTLLLVAAKPDRRKAFWKRLFDQAEVTVVEPLKGAKLRGYVAAELRRRRIDLGPDAAEILVERVGADLRRLMGEVLKLEAFAEGGRLTAEQVREVLGRGFGRPLYELSDAFCERRPARALEIMEQALDDGEAPLLLLATLQRGLRQMRAVRALQTAGVSRAEIGQRLLPPQIQFKLPELLKTAAGWSEALLSRAGAALERADRLIKSGAEGRATLVGVVAEACGARPVRPSPA